MCGRYTRKSDKQRIAEVFHVAAGLDELPDEPGDDLCPQSLQPVIFTNDQGDYETRTEWHRVFAWRNLSEFTRTLQKGQLITLEGTLRYRDVEDEVEGTRFKHRIAEVHATSMKRLSKVETADDASDGAVDE